MCNLHQPRFWLSTFHVKTYWNSRAGAHIVNAYVLICLRHVPHRRRDGLKAKALHETNSTSAECRQELSHYTVDPLILQQCLNEAPQLDPSIALFPWPLPHPHTNVGNEALQPCCDCSIDSMIKSSIVLETAYIKGLANVQFAHDRVY